MSKMSTCKGCEKKIAKEEKIIISNKSYCQECADKIKKEGELYNLLIQTICSYFDISVPTGLILKQIKDYKEQYNYTYSGIGYCLWYIKEIERKSFEVKYGIAYVKYYYEKAKEYFEQQNKIGQSVKIEKPEDNIKIVTIKANINKHVISNKRCDRLIDINSLFTNGEGEK